MPHQTLAVQGLQIEVPASYHWLIVHVQYSCGHKPQKKSGGSKGAIPATVHLRGDDSPHAGPCLPFLKGLRGCYVTEMVHQLAGQCPVCERDQ
ncbi:hypothetical protein PG994_009900 [Apiospora phragmitis]|uniref:Uncharacterized protein n=1 Tax=Apiospora phragmitis TaxID=2905665 RepID=A0ABR1TQM3_9PEZI